MESSIEVLEAVRAGLIMTIVQALPDRDRAAVSVDWALLRGAVTHLDVLWAENKCRRMKSLGFRTDATRQFGPQIGVIEQQLSAFEYEWVLILARSDDQTAGSCTVYSRITR